MNGHDGPSTLGRDGGQPNNATRTASRQSHPQQPQRNQHSQQRAGRWRSTGSFRRLRQMELSFSKGSAVYFKKAKPTNTELREHVLTEAAVGSQQVRHRRFDDRAAEIAQAQRADIQVVRNLLEDWRKGGHGLVPEDKPADTVRILFENWNSIQLFTGTRKINLINSLVKRYKSDVLAGVELQANWDYAAYDRQFHDLFCMGDIRREVVSYNRHESF